MDQVLNTGIDYRVIDGEDLLNIFNRLAHINTLIAKEERKIIFKNKYYLDKLHHDRFEVMKRLHNVAIYQKRDS